ncbi:fungal-specific transcription factor domain protein [Aspergillus ellipticus CBS 707.79]|uniref:Fungal-specific transcription factor domain protein n=1 Tax=Aspergillus ellipticus CBS 707.79 TaxID=1448320 RepID=A0A319DYT9_9EURO|nr:fungal-specific transcription factor domain protein [Aspergillus ellipticus CBS 707.79]
MEASIPARSEQERRSPDIAAAPKPRRRRNRAIHSCLESRRRKLKCDRAQPCVGCRTSGQQCIYIVSATRDVQFRQKLVQMKEAKDVLDRGLVEKIDGGATENSGVVSLPERHKRSSAAESDHSGDEEYLEPTSLASQDAAYSADTENDIYDVGIRLGRMRLGERVGGLYRPRIAEEVSYGLLHQPIRSGLPTNDSPPIFTPSPGTTESSEEYLRPGKYFTAPSVNLVLGPSLSNEPLISFIPPRHVADKILERYWAAVYPVARILHRPTFALRYETLWELVDNGYDLPPSLGAIVCAVLFSSMVSMHVDDQQDLGEYDRFQEELKARLQLGTEVALGKAQLLMSTKTETLQAFVAYLLAMCLDEVSRAHSVLVGMAIRLAECMGLHRDPSEYGFAPAECQIRRLIWYQICYLDIRTSEIQGPRPFIQPDGYTTRIPFELCSPTVWNDTVFSMIRFECQEMHRKGFFLRDEVDAKKISLTNAIAKLENFRPAMDNKYGPLVNGSSQRQPFQRMAGLALKLMVSLLYTCLLHRYMNSVAYRIPDRLRQIVLSTGADALEAAVELESADDLRPWSWYSRSYHQYHTAFLLLYEVFVFPMRKEAGRIWRCLDFIFAEPLANLPTLNVSATPSLQEVIRYREMKARYLLALISERMRVYQAAKGLKMPSKIQDSAFVITPHTSDDPDPSMGLNYAHADSDASQDVNQQPHDVVSSVNSTDTRPESLSSNPDGGRGITESTSVLEVSPYAWVSVSGGTASQSHNPRHVPPPSTQPVDAYKAASGYNPNGIDAERLEIDWNFWDTVFPPQTNDGELDVQDAGNFVWLA